MAQKSRTKDESFIIKLYEESLKLLQNEDEVVETFDEDEALDRYEIGQMIGLQKKAVDTICVLLAQANFIKKQGPTKIYLTRNGIKLAQSLLE